MPPGPTPTLPRRPRRLPRRGGAAPRGRPGAQHHPGDRRRAGGGRGRRRDRSRPSRAVPLVGGAAGRRRVVGVAMRTAPFAPYPLFVLPMPDAAAVALARALHDRGEPVGGVNGALAGGRHLRGRARRPDRRRGARRAAHPAAPARTAWSRRPRRGDACARPPPDEVDLVAGVVRRLRGGRGRAGRPASRARCTRWWPTREAMQRPDRARGGLALGRRGRHAGAPHGAPPAGVRRRAGSRRSTPRPSTAAAATPATPSRRSRSASCDARRRAVPLHRPGQPDVQPALRRARLPAGRRHGRPAADRRRAAPAAP